MSLSNLAADLQAGLPDLAVVSGSGADGYEVNGLQPAAIARPRDADEVAALLRFAGERGLAVTARGGGTMLGQGNAPRRLDLVLDLRRLDRILEHRPRDLTVTVEAGITFGALAEALALHGQMLALDPPLAARATVGGVLAANASGPRRQRYGTARDLLIGSRSVLADGTRVRAGGKVVKNVAGYDLNKLLIGSFGTLGVITEATFKLTPLPAALGLLTASFDDLAAAHAVALSVTRSALQPLSLELAGPGIASRLSGTAGAGSTADGWLLVIELGGSPATVERTAHDLARLAASGGAREVRAQDEQRERIMRRLRDWGRSAEDAAALILRASVLPADAPRAARALAEAAPEGGSPALLVRCGSGTVLSYWDERAAADMRARVARLRRTLGAIGGTLVVEQASPALLATVDAWGIEGADVALMRRVKDVYDPRGVLSPGRLV